MLQLPAPNNKKTFIISRQSVNDISALIIRGIRESLPHAKKTIGTFKGRTQRETAENLWQYLKDNVRYEAEPNSTQSVKTLPKIYHDRNKGNDCKHFTTFIASYLLAAGIPVKLRLVSFKIFDKTPSHIYPVAIIGGKDVPVDAVINTFNKNPNGITFYKDIKLK